MVDFDGFVCEKCGTPLPDNVMNCPKCGAPAPWNVSDDEQEIDNLTGVEENQFGFDKHTDEGRQERLEYIQKKKDIILSTTPSLEGYHIEEYIDLISEDVVFRVSLGDSVANGFENAISGLSFGAKELKGNTSAIESAKEYVRNKMIAKAITIGANAIVGIDFETSVGNATFARVSMNGTAVRIKKKE